MNYEFFSWNLSFNEKMWLLKSWIGFPLEVIQLRVQFTVQVFNRDANSNNLLVILSMVLMSENRELTGSIDCVNLKWTWCSCSFRLIPLCKLSALSNKRTLLCRWRLSRLTFLLKLVRFYCILLYNGNFILWYESYINAIMLLIFFINCIFNFRGKVSIITGILGI